MKITLRHEFEPEDFKGRGQIVIRNSCTPFNPEDPAKFAEMFASTVAYKVGYTVSTPNGVCLISLADGMVRMFLTIETLCHYLNEDTCGFRPAIVEEIVAIDQSQGNRFTAKGMHIWRK